MQQKRRPPSFYKQAPDKSNHQKSEEYHFKDNKKLPTHKKKACLDKLSATWSSLTLEQKIMFVVVSLMALGLTTGAIYYLLPAISVSIGVDPTKPPGLISLTNNTTLKERIRNTPIRLQPSFRAELESRGLGKLNQKYDKQAHMLRKLLPEVINQNALQEVLKEPNFSIELVPQNDVTLTANGQAEAEARFLAITNKILIVADTDMHEEQALRTLRNEFHHAVVRSTNFQKKLGAGELAITRKNSFLAITPFVTADWEIDHALEKDHQLALDKGFARLAEFEKMLKMNERHLAFFENKSTLDNYIKVAALYNPTLHHLDLSLEEFEFFSKLFKELPGKKYSVEMNDGRIIYIQSIKAYADHVAINYNFLKSEAALDKAHALLVDLKDIIGGMADPVYDSYNQQDKALELSSFIQEIEPKVLEVFFPEWCEYFSRYHHVENYCQL